MCRPTASTRPCQRYTIFTGHRTQQHGKQPVHPPSKLLERESECGEPGGSCMRNSGEVCRSQAREGPTCRQGGKKGRRGAQLAGLAVVNEE
jgi:hypothetical protein